MASDRKSLEELADELRRHADRLREEAADVEPADRGNEATKQIDDALAKLDEIAKKR